MKTIISILLLATSVAVSAETDLDVVNKIRAEGFYNSQVMNTLQHLTDEIGPRLSASPQLKVANEWTKKQLTDWGLKNAHLEGFEFGRGWSHDSASIEMIAPRKVSLHGIPVAWTPATDGQVTAEVVVLDAVTTAELKAYKGQLKDKIIMMDEAKLIGEPVNEIFKRHQLKDLTVLNRFDVSKSSSHDNAILPKRRLDYMQQYEFRKALNKFIKNEQVAGIIYRSRRQGGLINIYGKNHRVGRTFPVPAIVIEAEQYNLLSRLLEEHQKVTVGLNIVAKFHDEDTKSYNTIAEIPGKKRKDEIVMAGAHLDSWHASDGAVDNGAGVAVTMEAMRILKAINVKPNRTIRIGLWSGEEQGLHGSRAYVTRHFATRPLPEDKAERELSPRLWKSRGWPITPKKAYDKFSVYFNMDNGSGKFRGIYTEGNVAVKPIFTNWFEPYADLSAADVTNRWTSGTDHESFDDIGLPGFQFIQDPLDYGSRLHHTHIDSFDHVVENDLKQASVILAGFLYNAAMAENKMPRKPMPTEPSVLIKKQQQKDMEKELRRRQRDGNKLLDK
jgi:hypothetical protein